MKEQDQNPQEQLNEVEAGKLPEKRIQSNDSEDDSRSWKKNGGTVREIEEMFDIEVEDIKDKQRVEEYNK